MQNYKQNYFNPNMKNEYQDYSSRQSGNHWQTSRDNGQNRPCKPRSRSRSPINRSEIKPKFDSKKLDEPPDWDLRTDVCLDWFNSHLSLEISSSGFEAKTLESPGFETIWAGARATYGISSGRCFFEIRILENLRVASTGGPGSVDNVARVGWSINRSSFALGEEPLSFGYGGTSKKSTDLKFANYGQTYGPGDVIGAFCEFSYRDVIISFSKNGMPLGIAYQVSQVELEEAALFPHIYVKNIKFEVNFGQCQPWFPPPDPNWCQIGQVPLEYRTRGYQPPRTIADCEMFMMCGLPSSGKTTWAETRMRDMPEKNYTILGTNLILTEMKVMGLHRKANYRERWDTLFQRSNECLTKLLQIAPRRKRNYILDQTNVYHTAQNRKMKPFEGFRRIAVVMIPPDHVLDQRKVQSEKEEGKNVPEDSILDMKGNFSIPSDSSSVFDEIIFPELGREEAEELVRQYNEQGKQKVKKPGGAFINNSRSNFINNSNNRSRNESISSFHSDNSSSYGSGSKPYSSQSTGNDYNRNTFAYESKPNEYRGTPNFNRGQEFHRGSSQYGDYNYQRPCQDSFRGGHGRGGPGPSGINRSHDDSNYGRLPNSSQNYSSGNYNREAREQSASGYDQKRPPQQNCQVYGGSESAYQQQTYQGNDTYHGGSYNDSFSNRGFPDRGRGGFGRSQYGGHNRQQSSHSTQGYQQDRSHPGDRYQNYGAPPPDVKPPSFQPGHTPVFGRGAPARCPPFTGPPGSQPPNQFYNTQNAPYHGNPSTNYYHTGYQ